MAEVSDDAWGESSITWNNRPSLGETLDTVAVYSTGWIEFDVTSYVVGRTDDLVSLALFSQTDAGGAGFVFYNSRDHSNAALRPQLVLEGAITQGQAIQSGSNSIETSMYVDAANSTTSGHTVAPSFSMLSKSTQEFDNPLAVRSFPSVEAQWADRVFDEAGDSFALDDALHYMDETRAAPNDPDEVWGLPLEVLDELLAPVGK